MTQAKRIGRDCQQEGCDKTVSDGPLIRINPKGERGVFMCQEHAVGCELKIAVSCSHRSHKMRGKNAYGEYGLLGENGIRWEWEFCIIETEKVNKK